MTYRRKLFPSADNRAAWTTSADHRTYNIICLHLNKQLQCTSRSLEAVGERETSPRTPRRYRNWFYYFYYFWPTSTKPWAWKL